MHKTYKTKGTCSTQIDFDVEEKKKKNVEFTGGCNGNQKGIAALVEGQDLEVVKDKLRGVRCGFRDTSCPDQLARAIEECLK